MGSEHMLPCHAGYEVSANGERALAALSQSEPVLSFERQF